MYNTNEKQQFHLKIERSNINNNNVTLKVKGGLFYIHNSVNLNIICKRN